VNGEKTALRGNSKLGILAGLSMGPFVRGKYRRAGIRRFNYAENVKFINQCYLPLKILKYYIRLYDGKKGTYFHSFSFQLNLP
jgi:hypothetical protein